MPRASIKPCSPGSSTQPCSSQRIPDPRFDSWRVSVRKDPSSETRTVLMFKGLEYCLFHRLMPNQLPGRHQLLTPHKNKPKTAILTKARTITNNEINSDGLSDHFNVGTPCIKYHNLIGSIDLKDKHCQPDARPLNHGHEIAIGHEKQIQIHS